MGRTQGKGLVAGVLAIGLIWMMGPGAGAQTAQERLKLVVVLSRHGVRSPTWTNERLGRYSAQAWPEWSVQPGYLTAHGFWLLQSFGAYDRAAFAQEGLLSAKGCADPGEIYIWADTDERTLESGRALATGMFPECPPAVHSEAAGENDPVFHPVVGQTAGGDALFAAFSERVQRMAPDPAILEELQHVLQGCSPKVECATAKQPAVRLLDLKPGVARGSGDHIVDVQGPLPAASTLAEDFLLEYTEGMPQVGWGHVDGSELRRLAGLHTLYFDLIHRTEPIARLQAGPMVRTIMETLQQGVTGKPVAGAKGPLGEKVVYLVGHDTNLAGVATLLGLHWTLDGRTDDTPPGTQLVFELFQTPKGAFEVRARVQMQSLEQMRESQELTLTAPPVRESMKLAACGGAESCSWETFLSAASSF